MNINLTTKRETMQIRFNNDYLENLFLDLKVKGKPRYPPEVIKNFRKLIARLETIPNILLLFQYRGLNFEALSGKLNGFYSLRINDQYRLIISIENDRILLEEILIIEDLSKHYE